MMVLIGGFVVVSFFFDDWVALVLPCILPYNTGKYCRNIDYSAVTNHTGRQNSIDDKTTSFSPAQVRFAAVGPGK